MGLQEIDGTTSLLNPNLQRILIELEQGRSVHCNRTGHIAVDVVEVREVATVPFEEGKVAVLPVLEEVALLAQPPTRQRSVRIETAERRVRLKTIEMGGEGSGEGWSGGDVCVGGV